MDNFLDSNFRINFTATGGGEWGKALGDKRIEKE